MVVELVVVVFDFIFEFIEFEFIEFEPIELVFEVVEFEPVFDGEVVVVVFVVVFVVVLVFDTVFVVFVLLALFAVLLAAGSQAIPIAPNANKPDNAIIFFISNSPVFFKDYLD